MIREDGAQRQYHGVCVCTETKASHMMSMRMENKNKKVGQSLKEQNVVSICSVIVNVQYDVPFRKRGGCVV